MEAAAVLAARRVRKVGAGGVGARFQREQRQQQRLLGVVVSNYFFSPLPTFPFQERNHVGKADRSMSG